MAAIFKVGDKVKVVAGGDPDYGTIGTVEAVMPNRKYKVRADGQLYLLKEDWLDPAGRRAYDLARLHRALDAVFDVAKAKDTNKGR